jgi:NAD(P)H-dependent FMN reductase
MKLAVLLGSARKNSTGTHVAEWVTEIITSDKRFELDFVNVADLDLPFFNEDFSPKYMHYMGKDYTNPKGKAWAERVAAAEAFIFITPEYNHSTSAVLKNALDWVGIEWDGKPVGFVGYSITQFGGVRAVEHLRQIAPELGLIQTTRPVLVSNALDAIAENGMPEDDTLKNTLAALLDDIYALGEKLGKRRSHTMALATA